MSISKASSVPGSPGAASALALFVLAIIAGGGAANVYYHQPLLGQLLVAFGPSAPTFVATATLLGYGLGIMLLVPLGDVVPRRKLIATQQVALAAALFAASLAPSLAMLTSACVVVGVFATTAQQAIPFAAELAPPETRGRVVGRAMTGLLLGVLLARTASGSFGTVFGWRSVFAAAGCISLLLAVVATALLPKTPANSKMAYPALIQSVFALVRDEPLLRWATLTQGLNFAAFNAFWAALVLHLGAAPFHLGPTAAGLFGIIGAVGAVVAPMSGKMADRHGSHKVVLAGVLLVLASFGILGTAGQTSLFGIGAGVLVLDVGVTLAMIANQARVYALQPAARGRLNTVYMTGAFVSGGVGAMLGTRGFASGGWNTVTLIGAVCAGCAVLVTCAVPKKLRSVTQQSA
jgi:predicted MFS family arabinose efflux permease